MARRSGGFNTAIKVIKIVDRAQKQAARDAERQRKSFERDESRRQREYEKMLRQEERDDARRRREHEIALRRREKERLANDKIRTAAEKEDFKKEITIAKDSYDRRCAERRNLRLKMEDLDLDLVYGN